MKILVTGAAGFIGFHVARDLLARGEMVIGVDNLNDYYDVDLKQSRLSLLEQQNNFEYIRQDIADLDGLEKIFNQHQPEKVIHLAAQAGVRYSITHPMEYAHSNLVGFTSVLEACRKHDIKHLVFASSSSVYGGNDKIPFSVEDRVEKPQSFYGVTKRANELMAYSYAHLYKFDCTGLRFFTVYGPWGRPDMSYYKFAKNIFSGKPIDIYNQGKHARDFTYIDDITDGVIKSLDKFPVQSDQEKFRLYNLGNNQMVDLMYYISLFEKYIGQKAIKNLMEFQPGDVLKTCADIDISIKELDYKPKTSIEEGLEKFITWYRDYYKIKS